MGGATRDVRFTPKSRHVRCKGCPLWVTSDIAMSALPPESGRFVMRNQCPLLHHRLSPSWLSTERMMAMNATKVSTALTACEYSHCRRAASKASGVIVQLLVATFTGYVKIQKITCVAARQRTAVTDIKKAARSLRIVKVWIEVRRSAVIIGIPKKAQPA